MSMAEKWKIAAPETDAQLAADMALTDAVRRALEEDGDLRGMRFTDETLDAVEGGTLDVCGCVFERCVFTEMDLKRLSFVDCLFDKCEWSNLRTVSATFQRVVFRNCRMTGVEMMRGALMNTAFDACMLDYASFSEMKMDRAAFSQCRMRESLWADVKLAKVRFTETDLTRAQWVRTPLAGMDMSSCVIDGWNISLFDLRGAKVTAAQVISLSGLLGVEVIT